MSEKIPSDAALVRHTRHAVKEELKRKQMLQLPIARFDAKTGEVYLEHPDGTRTVTGKAMQRGRYSERIK